MKLKSELQQNKLETTFLSTYQAVMAGVTSAGIRTEPMMHILTAILGMTYDDAVGETRVLV